MVSSPVAVAQGHPQGTVADTEQGRQGRPLTARPTTRPRRSAWRWRPLRGRPHVKAVLQVAMAVKVLHASLRRLSLTGGPAVPSSAVALGVKGARLAAPAPRSSRGRWRRITVVGSRGCPWQRHLRKKERRSRVAHWRGLPCRPANRNSSSFAGVEATAATGASRRVLRGSSAGRSVGGPMWLDPALDTTAAARGGRAGDVSAWAPAGGGASVGAGLQACRGVRGAVL